MKMYSAGNYCQNITVETRLSEIIGPESVSYNENFI